jgi:large subunit ribosomal protein L15
VTDLNPETLHAAGLVTKLNQPIKLLATGEADRAYSVRGVSISASARTKIEAAGGKVEA